MSRLYIMESDTGGRYQLACTLLGDASLRVSAIGSGGPWLLVHPGESFPVTFDGLDAIVKVPALEPWEKAAAAHERFAERQGDTISGLQHAYAAEVIRGVMDRIRTEAADEPVTPKGGT